MYKRLTVVLAVMLCLALLTAFGMTVSATNGSSEPQQSESSVVDSSLESDTGSDSSNSSESSDLSSDSSSSDVSDSSDSSDSSNTSSDTDSESSDSSDTSSENSSSDTTSSRPNRPIYSGGEYSSNHFRPQDFSSNTSSQTNTTSSTTDNTSSNGFYDDEGDGEQYKGKAVSLADGIYKYLWIPIVLALLCIGGLVAVNVMFRKKYPKAGKGSHGTHSNSSHDGPHRRRKR